MTRVVVTGSAVGASLQVEHPIVILNLHYAGLAIARDLGALGVKVLGLSAVAESPGNPSRWVALRRSPDSLTHTAELIGLLLQIADGFQASALLLPTRDHDVNFIAKNRAVLETSYIVPVPANSVLERVMNKGALALLAQSAGLNVPRTAVVRDSNELRAARTLRFPCICKPVYASQWRKAGIWEAVGRQKVLRVETFEELSSFYAGFSHLDPVVAVQEWIEGGESNLQIFGSYCSADSEVRAFFTARKRLQYPPLAGTGILVEAMLLPELEEPSRRLLRALEFRGISEIEYKRDERDGRLYLIEVNPRHWDQHGLGTQVGVNLSEALYRDVTGQSPRPMRQSNERKLWIAEPEYLRHLVRCVVGKAPWRDAFLPFGAGKVGATFDRRDLRPFLSAFRLQ